MSDQTKNLPPVPKEQSLTDASGKKISHNWLRWLVHAREKINTISNSIATLAGVAAKGILVSDGSGGWFVRKLVAGSNVTITNPDGTLGDITIAAIGGGGTSPSYIKAPPVQDAVAANSNTSSKSVTLSSIPTNGNKLILCITISYNTTVSSVTQAGVTWTKLLNTTGFNPTVEIWIGDIGASASQTVTVTYAYGAFNSFWIGEFSFLSTGSVDKSYVSSTTTTSDYTGIINPSAFGLVVAVMGTSNGSTPFSTNGTAEVLGSVNLIPPAISGLSGNSTILGTLCVGIYQSNYQSQVYFGGNPSGDHASIIASIK